MLFIHQEAWRAVTHPCAHNIRIHQLLSFLFRPVLSLLKNFDTALIAVDEDVCLACTT